MFQFARGGPGQSGDGGSLGIVRTGLPGKVGITAADQNDLTSFRTDYRGLEGLTRPKIDSAAVEVSSFMVEAGM